MALVLVYLFVLVVVAAVLFGAASLLFGRGEPLPPLPRATTATVLPAYDITGADIDAVKFTQVLRGYKTSEVDWVLARLSTELESLRSRLAAAESHDGADGADGAAELDPGPEEFADAGIPDGDTVAQDRSGPT